MQFITAFPQSISDVFNYANIFYNFPNSFIVAITFSKKYYKDVDCISRLSVMLSEIEIRKFRAFKELHVRDLSRVNLFVGRNNSGKTTILEAAEMLVSNDAPTAVIGCAMRRGEIHIERDQERRGERYYVDVSHLFYGHRTEVGASFRIEGNEERDGLSLTCEVQPADATDAAEKPLFGDARILETDLSLSISHSSQTQPTTVPFVLPGVVSPSDIRRRNIRSDREERPVSFIKTESPDSVELQKLWNSIALTEEETNVIESLKILEPRIERIAFLSPRSYSRYSPSSEGIYIRLSNLDKRIPLGSLGDGIRHLLILSLAVNRATHGFVMVDEIDTGLHHSVMSDMWRVLIATAQRLDVQVFATTHSLDCVRSLAWLSNTEPSLCEGVRLHRVDENRSRTVVYTSDEISVASEQHVELRG